MIIGTAGHIDHGKTALVQRLTGVDTDRLPEEKERGLTIDLGFAHLDLPDGSRAGIVDVPGHERFVRTMTAGASGIDVALLVVAADDGVMPQTREHLAILSLLGIRRGVVAVTKIDQVPAGRPAAVAEAVRALLEPTGLGDAPICPVSAHTGEGIPELTQALAETLAPVAPRRRSGFFRLAVDRAFTTVGHGPVVTGSVLSGRATREDRLVLLPGGEEARVRGIQVNGEPVEAVAAGQRAALNLAGPKREALERGMMACDVRLRRTTRTVDAYLVRAPDAGRMKPQQRVRFHSGTAEVFARLLWLGGDPPVPGNADFAQLRLDRPVPVLAGDRFVVREETALGTLGGGEVLDPFAVRRGAQRPQRREALAELHGAGPDQALEHWLQARGAGGWRLSELAEQIGEPPEAVEQRLAGRGDLWRVDFGGDPWIAPREAVEALLPRLEEAVGDHLRDHPRAAAVPEATLRARVCPGLDRTSFRTLARLLTESGRIEATADGLRPAGHRPRFSAAEEELARRIEAELAFRGRTPPRLDPLAETLGQPKPRLARFLADLERAGRVVQVARGAYLTRRDFDHWRERALARIRQEGGLTLPGFRDEIGCGRELALRFLEYLDRAGWTRKEGDVRVAGDSRPREETAP